MNSSQIGKRVKHLGQQLDQKQLEYFDRVVKLRQALERRLLEKKKGRLLTPKEIQMLNDLVSRYSELECSYIPT